MKIEDWSVDQVKPYYRNPRKNAAAVEGVASSLKAFKFRQPIVVDKENVIVVGHTRYRAALQLGMETVPVHVADDLTEAEIMAYRLADNKTPEYSDWDMPLLELEIQELDDMDFDLSLTGFDDAELRALTGDVDDADYPALNDGDKESFQQRTFTLHDEQAATVNAAIEKAKEDPQCKSTLNANAAGNALALICRRYLYRKEASE